MPNDNNNGSTITNISGTSTLRGGTVTQDDFNTLSQLIERYGAEVVMKKVGKVCTRKARTLRHEYAGSPVADAFEEQAERIAEVFSDVG